MISGMLMIWNIQMITMNIMYNDLIVSKPEENTKHSNARPAEINDFDTGQLSESDTLSIPGSSNTITLHSIVSTTQESSISNVTDEDEV